MVKAIAGTWDAIKEDTTKKWILRFWILGLIVDVEWRCGAISEYINKYINNVRASNNIIVEDYYLHY